jgi:hypothetical protein
MPLDVAAPPVTKAQPAKPAKPTPATRAALTAPGSI